MNATASLYARITLVSTVFFFTVMFVAFPLIQPELDPLLRYGSEYASGRMGWLMKLNFFVWGAGLVAFALAMGKGLDAEARSRVAVALFMVAGLGIVLSGVFDSDLQVLNESPPPVWIEPPPSHEQKLHIAAGLAAFLSLMPGAGLVSRRLRTAGRLHGPYRWMRLLSWLLPVAFVGPIFLPPGLIGLWQRVFLVLVFAWLILAARGLEKGAFSR